MLKFLLKAGLLAAGAGLVLGALKKLEDDKKEKEQAKPEEDSLQAKPENMPETPVKIEPLNENLIQDEMKNIKEEADDGGVVYDDIDRLEEKLEDEDENKDLPAVEGEELPAVEEPKITEEK